MNKPFLILLVVGLVSCSSEDAQLPPGGGQGGGTTNQDWLIPVAEVFDGGPGRDGIPSLSNPDLLEASQTDFLFDDELVLGYYNGETAIAFPHQILDWHEIINQRVNSSSIVITYCPLTGTGIGLSQEIDNQKTEFGVSGLLYNNNLIAFDRNTQSNWSQMTLKAVNGPLIGVEMPTFKLVETQWAVWKAMYLDTKVVSTDTGWDRPYGVYPYGDFKTNNNNLFFPLSNDDPRLERKERVHGVLIDGKAKVYRFGSFESNNSLIMDSFEGEDIVVVGNRSDFMVSFFATLSDGSKPNFSAIDEGRAVLADDQGNKWDVFGFPVSGPTPLQSTQSFMGYWFAWGAFYPNPEIYGL
ncbi:MAG: DUF3179 domain-containing protein [Bacteroidetes bacterium]|nr:MAG: DUF3179 domain-containing protein [Bacteroidota bacterium]